MFVLGHVGIGRAVLTRWSKRLPAIPLVLGTLLPDIIDKPLYYARLSPYISCTRTFGHTGLLLVALTAAAFAFRSRALAALSAGVATHLLLDCAFDWPWFGPNSSAWTALAWPFFHRTFTVYYLDSIATHATRLLSPVTMLGEVLGMLLLVREWRQRGLQPRASPAKT